MKATTIEQLSASILADARSTVERIDAQTQEEVALTNSQTETMLARQREKLYAQVKQKQDEILQQAQAKRQLEATQAILAAKQQLLEETFNAARQSMAKLPTAERRRIIQHLWKKASGQLQVYQATVAKQDAKFLSGKCKVALIEGLGGFCCQTKDGKVRLDYKFETLLADMQRSKSAEVARFLFSTEPSCAPGRGLTSASKKKWGKHA